MRAIKAKRLPAFLNSAPEAAAVPEAAADPVAAAALVAALPPVAAPVEPDMAELVAATLEMEATPLEISLETEATIDEISEARDEAMISARLRNKYRETRQISIVRLHWRSQRKILRLRLSSQ
jgi:hypothetical protein